MRRGLLEELAGTDAEVNKPEGGFFLWIKLPSQTNQGQFAELAQEQGLTYVPGPSFFPNGGGEGYVRLAFSYDSVERCYEGGKLLGRCAREAML
jgi:2-aminoadipate transaminase